jgi:uncharacterized membrane protein YoaK (UPF0700 family)
MATILMPMHFLHRLAGKHRSSAVNQSLGRVLACVAGFINAGGFFIVHQYTSHMTGILSIAADDIALGDYFSTLLMLIYIACFVLGAFLTTAIVLKARERHLHAQYALPLLVESVLLVLIIVLHTAYESESFVIPAVIASLCFLMGLQNALITKASTAIIRTTHVTGMATDLGIEIGRALLARKKLNVGTNQRKAFLHFSIIATFFAGGVMGALSLANYGAIGLLPMVGLLLAISLPPILRDIAVSGKLKRRTVLRA